MTYNPEYHRNRGRMRLYGLTPEAFAALYNSQRGLCAVCDSPLPEFGHNTHVDHDHRTGENRGILCRRCNVMVGALESPLRPRLDEYLDSHARKYTP